MNNDELTLGPRISAYRKRAKMSQLDLEIAINAGQGSISRIENDQVNPTKETIMLISKALNLTDEQIASLFNLNVIDPALLIYSISYITEHLDINSIIQKAIDEIANRLGYMHVSIYLKEGDIVNARNINMSEYNVRALKLLPMDFFSLKLKLNPNTRNVIAKAVIEGKNYESNKLSDFAIDVFPSIYADAMQKVLGMKKGVVIPLKLQDKVFGAMLFIKRESENYENEMPVLMAFSRQVAIAINNAQFIENVQKQIKELNQAVSNLTNILNIGDGE